MAHLHHQKALYGVLKTTSGQDPVMLDVQTGPTGQHALTYVTINAKQFGPFSNSFTQLLGSAAQLKAAQVIVTTVVWDLSEEHNTTKWDMKMTSGGNDYDPTPVDFQNPEDKEGTVYQAVVYVV